MSAVPPRDQTSGPAPAESARSVVEHSPLPALLITAPQERILAASPAAIRLIAPHGEAVIGRNLEEFLVGEPSGGLDLVAAGRLVGYETVRTLRVTEHTDEPVHVWIRGLGDPEPADAVLAVLSPAGVAPPPPPPPAEADLPPVVGTAGPDLRIEAVSGGVTAVLGYPAADLLGQPIVRLVHPDDVARLLWGLSRITGSGSEAVLRLRALPASGQDVVCHALIVPLVPSPSFAFALLSGEEASDPEPAAERALWRLGQAIGALQSARSAAGPPGERSVLESLTPRQRQIVIMLVGGDRVPAIARILVLSQGTVRNHLSSVFRKLGIRSQQDLVVLLRKPHDPHDPQGPGSAEGTAGRPKRSGP